VIFADDTNIFVCTENETSLTSLAQRVIHKVSSWCLANKMVINAPKCGTVMFTEGHCSLVVFPCILNLYFVNILVPQTQVIKILGVFLDSNLSYKPHLSYLRSILSRHVGVLQRVQSFLHTEVMVPLYYRFFDSRLSCCYSIWGVAASSLITPMRRLQNIAVKAMFGPHQVYPSADLYNDTGIKNVIPW